MTLFSPRCLITVIIMTALLGAGCAKRPAAPPQEPSGPKLSTFDGVSPKEAAERINFTAGTSFEMRQTLFGFGAQLAAKLDQGKREGTRVIIIERFAPMQTADIHWQLTSKVESDASIKARAEAQRLKKPLPEPVMVDRTAQGDIRGFNLRDAHSLYPPAYWPEKENASAFGTSGIWLSDDVYTALDRNRLGTLTFGMLDRDLRGSIGQSGELKKLYDTLAGQMAKIENRVDVTNLNGEKELAEWELMVNGKKIKVEVIKAKSWFGEIVVLHNRQNPLVLKMTLNPLAAGVTELFSGIGTLQSLLGYEITALNDVQP